MNAQPSKEQSLSHSADHFSEDEDRLALRKPITKTLDAYYARYEGLKGIPANIIKQAWFTMSHLLLETGADIIDMGCRNGMMTYVMATLNPQYNFVGVDADSKKIVKARNKYVLPNLKFKTADITNPKAFEINSADAIINSFILHEVYSSGNYKDKPVIELLERQFSYLRDNGYMFIQGYSMPPPEKYVLMEMPDTKSTGEGLSELSEADLLVWFSEHARPMEDLGCQGFFMEEMPARFPQTRLFRLPYRWAYEFVIRKDDRDSLTTELPNQYTFFTPREFRKALRGLGARVHYTAPHWDEKKIRDNFDGRFRIYDDDGSVLGSPPTSFIAVSQKIPDGESVRLHERRPSNNKDQSRLHITAMRNENNGKIYEIVSRDQELTDILPYRVNGDGDLYVYVQESVPRGIANAVPRNGADLDGKRWSGHMTEAVSIPAEVMSEVNNEEFKDVVKFARDYLGLKPFIEARLETGPSFFPAPDFIDERIHTKYLNVAEHEGDINPRISSVETYGFLNNSRIREIRAQHILNAIAVGYIPNSQLEVQILALCERLGVTAESWNDSPLTLDIDTPEHIFDGKELMRLISQTDEPFKKTKGTTGQIRSIKSVFVDEGWVEGSVKGVRSSDVDFVLNGEHTHNKAVVMPLTRDAESEEVMAGVITEQLPVPQRYQGNGTQITLPSFSLPPDITSVEQAKKFVADEFGVTPDKVSRLGESYFCHIGVTPTRIFPFAVASSGQPKTPFGGPVQYAPMKYLYYLNSVYNFEYSMGLEIAWYTYAVTRNMMQDSDLKMNLAEGHKLHHNFAHKSTIETGQNLSGYVRPGESILGQGNDSGGQYSGPVYSGGQGRKSGVGSGSSSSSSSSGSMGGGVKKTTGENPNNANMAQSSGLGGGRRKQSSSPDAVDMAMGQGAMQGGDAAASISASNYQGAIGRKASTSGGGKSSSGSGGSMGGGMKKTTGENQNNPGIKQSSGIGSGRKKSSENDGGESAQPVSFHNSSPDFADMSIDVGNETFSAFSKKTGRTKQTVKKDRDYDAE